MRIRGNLDITGGLSLPRGASNGKALYVAGGLGETMWQHLHINEVITSETYSYGSLVISSSNEVFIAVSSGAPGNDLGDAKWDSVGSGGAGEKGDPGAIGAQGPLGDQGVQGVKGDQGIPGLPGTDGTDGTDGVDGLAGPQGAAGTGVTIKGADTYAAILLKPKLPAGDMWLTTDANLPTYDIGYGVVSDGASWNIVGQIRGPQGPVGPIGVGTQGAQGPAGAVGMQGVPGVQGLDGPQGLQGLQGAPGTNSSANVVSIHYLDLKALQVASTMVPGTRYHIDDYMSGENIVVMAASVRTLYNATSSLDYPLHTMEYNPDWVNATNTGYIFNRADASRGIFTSGDFMSDKIRRYKIVAATYAPGTYAKYITVENFGNIYMSLKDANTQPLGNTAYWSLLFVPPAGGDPLGQYEYHLGADPTRPLPFGLSMDLVDFKDYYIFQKADGSNGWDSVNNTKIEGAGNCLIFEGSVNDVYLGGSVVNNTLISGDIEDVMFVTNKVISTVIAGKIHNIALTPGAEFFDSYLQGAESLVIDGSFSDTIAVSRKAGVWVNAREIAVGSTIHFNECYVNVDTPITSSNLIINKTTLLGEVVGAGILVLNSSLITSGAVITNSSIYANTSDASSTNANSSNEIRGTFIDVALRGITLCVLDGEFTRVTASHWNSIITTNTSKALDVSFYIARWKRAATPITLDIEKVMVERVYNDISGIGSDKIWSSEFDINGIEIVKEIG